MRGWYVAKSKPQKEAWLKASLQSLGVETYYPRILGRDQRKQAYEPLFPTYLFCHFDPEGVDWPAIRWAPGLNYLLGVDGQPSRVPADMVDFIRQRVEAWNRSRSAGAHLNPGDRVMVAHGSFAGLEGVFQRYMPSRERCRILLHVVGRLTSVEMDVKDLAVPITRL